MACSEVATFLQMLGLIIFRTFSSQCHTSLVFDLWQIANNLSPIAKKFKLFFLALSRISLERTFNNLACALPFFYANFVHVLRCSKQIFQIKIYLKRSKN